MTSSDDRSEDAAPERGADQAAEAGAIDIARLAEKVYRLLHEDIRLERARGVALAARGGRRT